MRIQLVKGRDADTAAIVDHEYTAIDRTFSNLETGQIGLVFGPGAIDEFAAFTRKRRTNIYQIAPRTGSGAVSTASIVYRSNLMYAKDRNRVQTFLQKEFYTPHGSEDVVSFVRTATWDDLVELTKRRYVGSRRIVNGAEQEIRRYLEIAKSGFQGVGICLQANYLWTHEQVILSWLSINSKNPSKIVVCTMYDGYSWTKSSHISVRAPGELISLSDLKKAVQNTFAMPEQAVETAYRIWKKSLGIEELRIADAGHLTRSMASEFADAIYDTDPSSQRTSDPAIPKQQIAPLRFRSQDGILDILAQREHAPDNNKIVGGARSCKSAIEDILDHGGYDNTIHNFRRRIHRISEIVDQISKGEYDDALIVQLGNELSSLEDRIFSAKQSLSDSSIQESSLFFSTMFGFLSQFHIWADYKHLVARGKIDQDGQAFSISRDVLSAIKDNPKITTSQTRTRINDFVAGLENDESTAQREGTILSAENVAALAASELVKVMKESGRSASSNAANLISASDEAELARWFVQNAPKLQALARSKGLEWLETLLGKIGP